MLFFFRPKAYGGTAPIPASIVGPWIVQELKKRKKRQEEEAEKKEAKELKEEPQEVEKATKITIEALKEDSTPTYSKELEKELRDFALASARLDLLSKEIELLARQKAIEEESLRQEAIRQYNLMVEREIALEMERQRIAKKILEMQEEEEALLFLLLH